VSFEQSKRLSNYKLVCGNRYGSQMKRGSYCEAQWVRKGTRKLGLVQRSAAAEASLHVGLDSVLGPRKTVLDMPALGGRNTKTCSFSVSIDKFPVSCEAIPAHQDTRWLDFVLEFPWNIPRYDTAP